MDTKKLRQKILDLAIHGKLVPQDPNDEPASVLLERIRAEKERLIAEGKIKRSKKSSTSGTSHYENVPFELPEGWCWCTISDICSKIGSGSTPRGSNYAEDGIPFFRSQNVYNDGLVYDDIKYISEDVHKSMIGTEVLAKDLLLNITGGSLGRCAVVPHDFERGNVSQHVCILRTILILPEYLHCFIISDYFSETMILSGSGREGLPKYSLEAMMLPIPPLSEQSRIVASIERWVSIANTLDENTEQVCKAVDTAKSKILDLAIHGKLVPQDANDEPASELLKRVNPKAVVTCDNPHYENVPNGWIMLKGKYLFESMKSTKPTEEFFKYIDIDSIDNRIGIVTAPKVLPSQNAPSRASRYTCKGDVLFSMVRPYLRNIAIVPENNCIASTGFFVCHPIPVMTAEFCYFLMKSSYIVDGLNQFMKGDNSPSINNANITDWIYPIPPLEEQNRIVKKIKKLYGTIDCIAEALL